ncbi:MAG: T9SS type A sorting domain-containing protein, partial [Sphingomonadales bacterium]|nr:T9SS type A sorting domain-containing protein [Sphingomonadales bacterium]
ATSNITIIDTTPPQLSARSVVIALNESGAATIQPSDIDNGSYDNCSLSLSVSPSTFSCGQVGTNTVFLSGTDGVNTSFVSTTIQVVDNRAPRVVTRNVLAYLNSSGEAFITPSVVDSASTDNCGITSRTLSTNYFNCQTSAGNNIVTLFMRDAAGNLGSGTATVTLLDTFPPYVLPANMPADVVLGECQATYFYNLPIPSDNCLGATVRQISGLPPGSTFPIGVRSNVFEVRDVFGNTDTVRFNVSVIESAPLVPYVPPGRTFCSTDAPFDLTSVSGVPGTGLTGYNIIGGGMRNPTVFDPAQAPLGNFNLRYDYTDSFGCVTTGYIPMEVLPAPSEPLIERVTATLLKAPPGYSAYQWYRYGGAIPGATSSTYDVVLTGVYEVRVMNGAGCFRMSPPYGFGVGVGVDELNKNTLNIYPNPSGGLIQVDYSGRDQDSAEIQVFDMSGRRMTATQLTAGTAALDLSQLAPGRYLVHLRASDKSLFQSIVINSNR